VGYAAIMTWFADHAARDMIPSMRLTSSLNFGFITHRISDARLSGHDCCNFDKWTIRDQAEEVFLIDDSAMFSRLRRADETAHKAIAAFAQFFQRHGVRGLCAVV